MILRDIARARENIQKSLAGVSTRGPRTRGLLLGQVACLIFPDAAGGLASQQSGRSAQRCAPGACGSVASRPGLPWTVFLLSRPFCAYLLSACWRSHWPFLRGRLGAEWCHSQGVLWAPAVRACASLLAPRGRTVCLPGLPAFPLRSCLTGERSSGSARCEAFRA